MQQMSNKKKIHVLVSIASVTAIYVALTMILAPISFGSVQFRVSEVLMLLCFYKKHYCIALSLGCLISNLFSPLGYMDIIFGTLATAISAVIMYLIKNIYLAAAVPCVINALIVGAELYIVFNSPFWLMALSVLLGEAGVLVVGVIIFKALEKNNTVSNILMLKKI